ncbi:DUF4145 domain-containing protein [Enterococcus faecalis]|uniref:DUF4145 domain-containing protein n=1 Tax=Enterococcus faecalis TaxID=1351 RepID=UPI0021AE3A60|nr:DUF4145 domain-containing protein [Enterococcus faecalis]
MKFIKTYSSLSWRKAQQIMERAYKCGYCGNRVSSLLGLPLVRKSEQRIDSYYQDDQSGIYICTHCQMPSFFWDDIQIPGHVMGNNVKGISDELSSLYDEARNSYSVGAYTGVVLLCRKLLMNISVELGAEPNKKFIEYVDYLNDKNYISANSRGWVDKIRTTGNEATHETVIKTETDASNLIKFCEMIMVTNFEYPNLFNEND